jgi:hypothetical protein
MSNFLRTGMALVLFASIGCQTMQPTASAPEPHPVRDAVKSTAQHTAYWSAMAVAVPVYLVKNAADRVQGK